MDPIKFKDEKQFKDMVQLSIFEKIKPELVGIFGTGHPAIHEIINDIFKKATAAHKERHQKEER